MNAQQKWDFYHLNRLVVYEFLQNSIILISMQLASESNIGTQSIDYKYLPFA
jgi:hypothetical protein